MDHNLVLGIVSLVCGTVMLVYGATLFRFVLAFAGFYLGFTLSMIGLSWLGDGAPSQTIQMVISLVLGAVCAGVLYSLVRITVYAAGAMLGLVLGLLISSLFSMNDTWVGHLIAIGALVLGAAFGRTLGAGLTIFASALAGAYVSVTGLAMLFGIQSTYGLMPVTQKTLVVFIVFAAISVLAQFRVRHLRTLRLH